MPDNHAIGSVIPLPKGNRWVIGDIHGCHKTFLSLLHKIQLKAEDQLFLLGDFINKGPSSLMVLQEIIHLKGNVFPLLGNHDKIYLDYYSDKSTENLELLKSLRAGDLIHADRSTQEKIALFYQRLPYYYASGNTLLVHAGFNFELDNVFSDSHAMLNIKNFRYDPGKVSGKRIIHGHFPTPLNEIKHAIEKQSPVIPLDNGCVYQGNLQGIGNLIGLELNEMKLVIQPNIDQT